MKKDSATCYDIESKIFNFRQGTLSVTEYYGTLNGLWIELNQYQGLKMCKADFVADTGLVERGRIFKFLHDLNFEYNPIRVARVLFFQMSVPNSIGGEAILTATYFINRLPTRVLNGISLIKYMLSFFLSSPIMLSLPKLSLSIGISQMYFHWLSLK
ncbi:hypothetical protein CR513_02024, partial [Mucuna pruriens]